MGKPSVSDIEPIIQLSDEFLERYRRGERPRIEEYAARYPAFASRIRELFPSLVMMEELAPQESRADELPVAPPPDELPDRIGDYQILRKLGQGGMGVVYEAEQQSLRRRVALKLLSPHARGKSKAFERFQLEAQAAARLHHPNIVPVLGFGQDAGVWYYAMQLIHGHGLDQVLVELRRLRGDQELEPHVAGHSRQTEIVAGGGSTVEMGREADATTPDRWSLPGESDLSDAQSNRSRYFRGVARIGIQVARALACAHAEGIVHRDIKPSNLLLDMQANVWVTDFGLAKAQNADLTDTGDIVGTLRYMAPERFRGWSDPRSDVYGLGITLYELLVFRPAFDCADRVELIRRATHDTPPLPRSIDPSVPRELETVVLKAIAKEPSERYQSAGELADDLQRFLDDKPVRARRAGLIEHSIRWYRRNRLVGTLAGTLIVVLALGLAAAILLLQHTEHQRRNADEAFQKSHEAVDKFVDLTLRNEQLDAEYRQKVLSSALAYYEDFVRRSRDDPALREKLARTYRHVGGVCMWQGRHQSALDAYTQQQELLQALFEQSPDRPDYRVRLAEAAGDLAAAQVALGNGALAETWCRQGLQVLEPVMATDDSPYRLAHANLLGSLAQAVQLAGQPRTALQAHLEALRLRRLLVNEEPTNDNWAVSYATEALNGANAHFALGELAEARQLLEQAIPTMQNVRQRHPLPELAIQLSQLQGQLSRIQLRTGEYEEALRTATLALRTHAEATQASSNSRHAWIKMNLLDRQASAHWELGNVTEARAAWAAALQLQGRDVRAQGGFLARILTHYGESLRFEGDGAQAVGWLKQSEEVCRLFLKDKPHHVPTRHELAIVLGKLAEGYAGSSKYAEQAGKWLAQAVEIHEQLVQQQSEVVEYRLALAGHYRVRGMLATAQGDLNEASGDFERAAELCAAIREGHSIPEGHTDMVAAAELARIGYYQGQLLTRQKKSEEAITAYRQAIDNWRVCYPQGPPNNVASALVYGGCYCNLGLRLLEQNDVRAAEEAAREAIAILELAARRDPQNRAATSFLSRSRKLLATIQAPEAN